MDEDLVRREVEKVSSSMDPRELSNFLDVYSNMVSKSTDNILRNAIDPSKALVLFFHSLTNIGDRKRLDVEEKFENFLGAFTNSDPINIEISELLSGISSCVQDQQLQELRSRLLKILEENQTEEFVTETISMGDRLGVSDVKSFLSDYLSVVKKQDE